MKLRYLPACVTAAGAAAAIAVAPTAGAAPTALGQTCTYVGSETTQCQSPGNVQINDAHQVPYQNQYPFWGGNVLLFHHGGHHR